MRGPFNVNAAAIEAGVAAMGDRAHVEKSRRAQRQLAALADRTSSTRLGLRVTPSVGNFVLIHFPDDGRHSAEAADAFLTQRGYILRRVVGLRLSQCASHDGRHRGRQSRRRRSACPNFSDADQCPNRCFQKIALVGIGLIGSSLAHVVRRERLADHIAISTPQRGDAEAGRRARASAIPIAVDAAEAVRDADLVVVSVPVGASGAVAKAIAGALKPGAILTDVGSTKGSVVAQMAPHVPAGVHFIPGHPIAGTEHSGPDAGFADLFEGRWCILTPPPGSDPDAVARLTQFWERCGSKVDTMDPAHHDMVLAIVSHLPHIIAYNIVGTADDLEAVTKSEVIKYSASGFRDFTRLAASDPTMWRDVCLHNKDAILEMLARFSEDLSSLQRAIRWGDGDKLFDLFTRTRAVRRSIIEAGQEIDAPDFGRQAVEHPKG